MPEMVADSPPKKPAAAHSLALRPGEAGALYQRVATKLGVTRAYVRQVALGARHSESVLAALNEESKQTV